MAFYTFLPKILNMSLTASVAIVFVLLLRLLLKKAPKVISYALWAVVLIRLLCPVSIESGLSLFGLFDTPTVDMSEHSSAVEYIPSNIVHTEFPEVVLPVPGVGEAITEVLPQGEEQLRADPLEGPIFIATYVWWGGILVMAVYGLVTYLRLRRRLITASPLRDNIYLADDIDSPFVMGLFRPKIYLPSAMEEREQSYIILHEQHHIRRLDHVVKALAFAALCIHWFNPLVWVAFIFSGKDMEMSCDEAVVRKLGTQIRADYTASLLSLATGKRIIAGMPLAFGEGNTKGRIRNLAKWKKPAVWVVIVAVIVCIILAVCLLTNPITMGDHFVLTNTDSPANTNKLSYDIQLGNKAMSGQIYIEQWIDGVCVKSAPIIMTQYVDSIDIVMRDRREDGTSVGTDIQIETNQYGGSLLTYFEHPESFNVIGWGFKGYELNEKNKLTSNEEVILAAKVFDNGSGIRAFDCETLVNEPERIKDAGYMIVVRAVFSEDPLGVTSHSEASFPTEVLTLNDVIILSQKGYDLSWADFENYDYIETGSGLYIRVYEINARFRLMIGGGGPDSDPMYIYLALANDLDTRIDIRDGGVTEFISEYGNLAPTYHPEGILHLGLNAEIVEIDTSNHILYVKDIDESADVFGDRCAIDCNYAISRFNLLYVNYGDANDVRTIGFNDFQMGDAVIIGLYDSEKQKALNGAAVAEQVQLGTQRMNQSSTANMTNDEDPDLQYYLTIGAEGVKSIELSMPSSSGGCENADGSLFKKGERIWLENLDGYSDLRGLTITALGKDGEVIWTAFVPNNDENKGFTHLTQDGWTISNLPSEDVVAPDQDEQWNDGVVFDTLAPNEEKLSSFDIVLEQSYSTVECTIGFSRTGLTLTYGLISNDGKEYASDVVGGDGRATFENLPAGSYRLFVRNSDYSGVPAYENPESFPDVSFNATGVMNYRVQ